MYRIAACPVCCRKALSIWFDSGGKPWARVTVAIAIVFVDVLSSGGADTKVHAKGDVSATGASTAATVLLLRLLHCLRPRARP